MIIRLDHVGVATGDPQGVGDLLATLGLAAGDRGNAETYGVSCEFWQAEKGGGAIELVAPLNDEAAVSRRLAEHGPGLYHIAFEVDDVAAELARLRGLGLVALDSEPQPGARPGMWVAFVYAKRPAGLLIELVEYRRTDAGPTGTPADAHLGTAAGAP
ncbi:VOC family protein [Kitasatospora sp. GAS204B]|uniref:VOC family protein n=1 Tax=unclassified Kitasatospora TaxID=2633591 RepID=UPI002473985C|nr:VOC family protein [Kitasatospora sp. GAS204B]MDH6122239.1 methylmalonyl-CoA/ethylmalonyl-CoA epimerase [Kitasatospora sp. GAS204B]